MKKLYKNHMVVLILKELKYIKHLKMHLYMFMIKYLIIYNTQMILYNIIIHLINHLLFNAFDNDSDLFNYG